LNNLSYTIGDHTTQWTNVWATDTPETYISCGWQEDAARLDLLDQFGYMLLNRGVPCVMQLGSRFLAVYCSSPQADTLLQLSMQPVNADFDWTSWITNAVHAPLDYHRSYKSHRSNQLAFRREITSVGSRMWADHYLLLTATQQYEQLQNRQH